MIVVQLATGNVLLLILQRYYFESESQPCWCASLYWFSCCLSYKDTILKANHSLRSVTLAMLSLLLILQRYYFESESQQKLVEYRFYTAVAYPTKILFWKRITAIWNKIVRLQMLLLILQRYYFESESQRIRMTYHECSCCCLSYKDTILKANHSIGIITGWKAMLLLILQRYYFESESQLNVVNPDMIVAVAYPTKILFWKRITAKCINTPP